MTGDLNATFEHRPISTPRRFYVFMRRTTNSNFSFLISNFSFKRSFQTESKGSTSKGLTQSPVPSHQSLVPRKPKGEFL